MSFPSTTPASQVHALSDMNKTENETFITQRGGKILNEIQSGPVPPIPSLFENRKTLQSTLLLQKKKEMQQVEILLDKKRVEFAKRMDDCKEKQEELRIKQKQIRDRVIKFEKFLKENDAKRQRANIKAQNERKLRETKEMEYNELLIQLHQEQQKAERMSTLMKKHQCYEDYLQSVVDSLPSDYLDINEPHINDVLMRHKTLLETNDDLIQTVQTLQDSIEKEQNKLANIIKEKNDLILVYNSSLGNGQKKLEKLKQDVALMEQRLKERDNGGKQRMRIIGEAKLAINNLYLRVATKSKQNHPIDAITNASTKPTEIPLNEQNETNQTNHTEKSLAEKLHAIQDRFLDLQLVVTKVEEFMENDE